MKLLRTATEDLKEESYTVVYLDGLLSDKEKEVYYTVHSHVNVIVHTCSSNKQIYFLSLGG